MAAGDQVVFRTSVSNRCSDQPYFAQFVPVCALIGLQPNFCFLTEPKSAYKGLQPNFLDWLVSSAGVARSVSWQKRREPVAWY